MADASNLKVAVESAVNDAIRDLIGNVYDQYKIKINSVSAEWVDVSTVEKRDYIVVGMRVEMTTDETYSAN